MHCKHNNVTRVSVSFINATVLVMCLHLL